MLQAPWQTSEFWLTLMGGGALIAQAFGVPHVGALVAKYGPALAVVIAQRVVSKTVKPGQIPFSAAPAK